MIIQIFKKRSQSIIYASTIFTATTVLITFFQLNDVHEQNVSYYRNSDSDKCILPIYDFWENDLKSYTNPKFKLFKNCNREFKPMTELENGKLRKVVDDTENIDCRARCHTRFNDTSNQIGQWIHEPGTVDCEILETVCSKGGEDVYGHLHSQIMKKNSSLKQHFKKIQKTSKKPNVIVIVLDSIAFGHAKRSLKKTTQFLVDQFQAVEFPFINKVGENSRPNGVPLWFGKSLHDIDNTKSGGEHVRAEWTEQYFCNNFKDNETSIFNDAKDAGYTTMYAEDWAKGLLNYPDCKGFSTPLTDHYMRPFQVAYEFDAESITKKHLEGVSCREIYHPIFEYLQQFIDAYPESSKFSWLWSSGIGHEWFNGFYRSDDYLVDFFTKNRQVIDDSFLFFMGDHGIRIPAETWDMIKMKTFQLEIDNPYLAISVPKKLRNNGIIEKLEKNSKSLQTHFDTRATILDIMKYQSATNFTSTYSLHIPNEKGNSLLRQQPDFVRNCRTLPIPPEFCICKTETVELKDEKMSKILGEVVKNHINEILLEQPIFTTNCMEMQFNKTTSLERYVNKINKKVENYRIDVETVEPSMATYRALVQYDSTSDSYKVENVIRTNRYGHTADCIGDATVRPFCYCRSNAKSINTSLDSN